MARLTRPQEKRTRMTFYVREQEAKRLEVVKKLAHEQGLTICYKDDFTRWLAQQLDQLEKALRSKEGSKRGGNNG